MDQRCGSCKEVLDQSLFSPSYRGKNGTWCRACFAAHMRGERTPGTIPDRTCSWCGDTYTPKQARESSYCSRACKGRARNEAASSARLARKAMQFRPCALCFAHIGNTARTDARYCTACARKAHLLWNEVAAREGLTQAQARAYGIAALVDEHGAVCALCEQTIDLSLCFPDVRSLSIDHVVPVASGGTHDPSNLRPSHLGCNARKGNRKPAP